jgi:hypothetical protein
LQGAQSYAMRWVALPNPQISLHAYVSSRSGFVKHFTVRAQSTGYRRTAKAAPGEEASPVFRR